MPTTHTPTSEVTMIAVVARVESNLDAIERYYAAERTAQAVARDFAAIYSTPSVLRGIAAAEAGRVTWIQLARLYEQSLGEALTVVRAGGVG